MTRGDWSGCLGMKQKGKGEMFNEHFSSVFTAEKIMEARTQITEHEIMAVIRCIRMIMQPLHFFLTTLSLY